MLKNVINIAHEAGEIIREGFGKQFSIEFKTNESNLVTEIDKRSEEAIIAYIKKEFPSHGILSEESGGESLNSEYLWVIDPIDGTTNFAHGLPLFSVSIGLQKNGSTICGVVYDVMRDVTYAAELGGGAYANSKPLAVSHNDNLRRSLLVTGFPYDIAENPSNAIQKFASFIKVARGIRRLGSAALDLCFVAEGVFDGYWEVFLNPWDMCAGILLVEEAGGKVTDFTGERMTIFSKQILASNGHVHQDMLKIIKDS